MTTPPDLVLVPRESISISGYRGDKTLLERLQETPLPSLNRICQDRKDAAHFIEAMIASAPSQEGGWQPDWRSVYENVAHTNDGDQDIIGVTRETLRLAQSAIRQSQSRDAYHNYDAAERELIAALSIRSLKKRDSSEKM